MFVLKSDRLRVEIANPEDVKKATSRFDPTGFISEIILDGTYYFAASEPHNVRDPSSGGRGLCSEFRFDGLSEVQVGQWAPKFGVGLLKKPDQEKFVHYKQYEKRCYPWELVDLYDSGITFRTLPIECLGYAVQTTRTLQVMGNSIYMTVALKNLGNRPVTFREYCHNFLSLDGMALGPDYKLELPNAKNLQEHIFAGPSFGGSGSAALYEVRGNTISPRFHNPGPAIFDFRENAIADSVPFVWKLSHHGAGLVVEGMEFFRPAEVCIWSYDHMLCPEVNFKASVKPGEEVFWKRKWTFFQEKEK